MTSFEHTIQDLESITGVQRKYIDRCYEIMPWLDAYRRKSPETNKYFYDSGAIETFHKVKELKDQGLDRQQIKQRLEEMGVGSREETRGEGMDEQGSASGSHPTNALQSAVIDPILSEVKSLYERMLTEKDKRIEQEQETTEAIRGQMRMLLPDGKKPEQIRAELEEKARSEQELETLRARNKRIQAITDELTKLDGRWGKGKRRKELLKILAELSGSNNLDT